MVAQGEVWLMETPNQKRRPVLVAVPKSVLTRRFGELRSGGHRRICDALDALANC